MTMPSRKPLLLLSCLMAASTTRTVVAQSQKLNIGIPGIFEVNVSLPSWDDDDGDAAQDDDAAVGGSNNNKTTDDDTIDFSQLFSELGEFIGENLDNFTLPPELEEIFQLPSFEDFDFSFGGNCTMCDNETALAESPFDFEGVPCSDWAIVSTLGVPVGSEQCDLLRIAAVQYCGCPNPAVEEGRTCDVCPEGQGPSGKMEPDVNETLGMTCQDLVHAPAVDGDRTCNTIAKFTHQCDCRPITTTSTADDPNENPNAAISAAVGGSTRLWRTGATVLVGMLGIMAFVA